MTVEDFFEHCKGDRSFADKSRMLIIRNRIEQTELRKLFESRPQQFGWVRLSQCVKAEAFIPPADRVLKAVREEVAARNAEGKIAYVTGLSALMMLWDYAERSSAIEQIRDMLDDAGHKCLIFVRSYGDEAQLVFTHPRYAEGKSVLVVGDKTDDEGSLEMRLVSYDIYQAIDGVRCPSLGSFLSDFEIGGFSSQAINIMVDAYKGILAGVSGSVRQVFREGDYLRLFCNYDGGLGETAERWLYRKMLDACRRSVAAKDFAQSLFFQGNMSRISVEAPRMILGCKGDELEVFVWMLKQSLRADCYLSRVLADPNFNVSSFRSCYVNEAVNLVGDVQERALCAERRAGIQAIRSDGTIPLDAEIADFIERTKGVDSYQIVSWLTTGTRFERQEVVRRLRTVKDLATLPRAFFDALPLLEDYIAPYALGDACVDEYFEKYRAQKIANVVVPEFYVNILSTLEVLAGMKSRDEILSDPSNKDAALVVVDAMGVEYLPLLLSMARKQGLDVASADPAKARIPTSTRFNPVGGHTQVIAENIPDLDNIIHKGVHAHGVSTDEENFVAMLSVFSERVMPAVALALSKFKRVILTADHGASRLAVLANRQRLAKTLPVKGVSESAEDWRYLAADPNVQPPDGVASNLSGDWWVVKGYDRFSKSGGKLNELHGGMSLEEVLVPVLVFEKGATYVPPTKETVPPKQFVENDEFDL